MEIILTFQKEKSKNDTPIKIINLNPIQMPHVDINETERGQKTVHQRGMDGRTAPFYWNGAGYAGYS